MIEKNVDAFRTISEVAEELDLPQHVLRFWETRFTQIRPLKRGGGRRYYRPEDVDLLRAIRQLLYGEGYTIKGVQRILKEQGAKAVISTVLAGGVADDAAPAGPAAPIVVQVPAEQPRPRPPSAVSAPARPVALPQLFVDPPPVPVVSARPVAVAAQHMASPALSAADVARLRAALAELAECERILAAARRV